MVIVQSSETSLMLQICFCLNPFECVDPAVVFFKMFVPRRCLDRAVDYIDVALVNRERSVNQSLLGELRLFPTVTIRSVARSAVL